MARGWLSVFQNRLSDEERLILVEDLTRDLSNWNSHGTPLDKHFRIIANQILLIVLDESSEGASGCSIDAMLAIVKKLANSHGLSIFSPDQVVYWDENNNYFKALPRKQFKEDLLGKQISPSVLIVDSSRSDFASDEVSSIVEDVRKLSFVQPLNKSWASYLSGSVGS